MSEYHYYEFQAVDRSLSVREQAELRRLSTRATLTPHRFANTSRRSHLKGPPEQLLERYFDAFIHVAHTRRGERLFLLRLPRRTLAPRRAAPYLCEGLSLRSAGSRLLLRFRTVQEQPEAWEEDEEWMPSLLPLRGELLAGDLRCLYLGWLAWAPWGDLGAQEPPPPPGLGRLSAALDALARFLRLDPDLLAVAAEASPSTRVAPTVPRQALSAWLASLPAREKDALLLRVAEGESLLGPELLQRYQEVRQPERAAAPSRPPRTVRQLLEAAEQRRSERQLQAAERWAREEVWLRKEQAEAREQALQALAEREPQAWHEVEALLASRRPQGYEAAVRLLVDLRELARRQGRLALFRQRLRSLRLQHARKPRLLERLDLAGLGPG